MAIAESELKEELEALAKTTKREFDIVARLKGRGLRKGSITLYLDEELGSELGWAYDLTDKFGMFVRRVRHGILGDLDEVEEAKALALKQFELASENPEMTESDRTKGKKALDAIVSKFDERIAGLSEKRDEMVARLTDTGLTLRIEAVPPVIQKDCRRKAKAMLKITSKNIPDDIIEEFELCKQAHLMSVMIQSITDNETKSTNVGTTYDEAIALIDHLPPGQFQRLDAKLADIQFTDAISRSIESQEDF